MFGSVCWVGFGKYAISFWHSGQTKIPNNRKSGIKALWWTLCAVSIYFLCGIRKNVSFLYTKMNLKIDYTFQIKFNDRKTLISVEIFFNLWIKILCCDIINHLEIVAFYQWKSSKKLKSIIVSLYYCSERRVSSLCTS